MAQLPGVFRQQDHETMDDFTPLPAGEYTMQIVKSELKNTKNHTPERPGQRLVLTFKVIDGEYAGKVAWNGLNIVNANPTAVEIANKEFCSICEAVGKRKEDVEMSEQLHMIPMKVTLAIKPADANWPEQNIFKKYEPLEGTAVAAAEGGNPFEDDEG
jgi:hypothetical protein